MNPEAIEAAANWLPHSGDCEVRPERDCTCYQPRVAIMRAALAAALPFLVAQAKADALRELADGLERKASISSYTSTEEVTDAWLGAAEMARREASTADRLEGK